MVVLGKNPAADGYRWVRVRLAILPNGSTGWIRRNALGDFHVIHTQLELDREQLTLTLYRRGRQVFRARVGIGQPQWPTPPGRFYVRERLAGFDDPFYWTDRVRDERQIAGADGLARRRVHRHSRHEPAAADPGPDLARLYPAPQR